MSSGFDEVVASLTAVKDHGTFADRESLKIAAGAAGALSHAGKQLNYATDFADIARKDVSPKEIATRIRDWSARKYAEMDRQLVNAKGQALPPHVRSDLIKAEFLQELALESILGILRGHWTIILTYPLDRVNMCERTVGAFAGSLNRYKGRILKECESHQALVLSRRDMFPEFSWAGAADVINQRIAKLRDLLALFQRMRYLCHVSEAAVNEDLGLFYLVMTHVSTPSESPVTLLYDVSKVAEKFDEPFELEVDLLKELMLVDQRHLISTGREPFTFAPRPKLLAPDGYYNIKTSTYRTVSLDISYKDGKYSGSDAIQPTDVERVVSHFANDGNPQLKEYIAAVGSAVENLFAGVAKSGITKAPVNGETKGPIAEFDLGDDLEKLVANDPYAIGILLAKEPKYLPIVGEVLQAINATSRRSKTLANIGHGIAFGGLAIAILTGHVFLAGGLSLLEVADDLRAKGRIEGELMMDRNLAIMRPKLATEYLVDGASIKRAEIFQRELNASLLAAGIVAPVLSAGEAFWASALKAGATLNRISRINAAIAARNLTSTNRLFRTTLGGQPYGKFAALVKASKVKVASSPIFNDISAALELLGSMSRTASFAETRIAPIVDWIHMSERGYTTVNHAATDHLIIGHDDTCKAVTYGKNAELDQQLADFLNLQPAGS
jgi:hypothetical protein